MTTLQDCLGRITRPLLRCKECTKDEGNLRCPEYRPCASLELIEVEDVFGEQGRSYMDEIDKRHKKVSE